jgi:hypothetical protein
MTDVCREFGVSRKTGYKIFDCYKERGLAALSDRSRRPVRYANQLPELVERLIVRLKAGKPHWGARCQRRGCGTLIDAALPVSIVGLQDADKVRHAGPIPVIGRDWHLKIWCGLALPKPPHEIGNLLHGAHSERGARSTPLGFST